MKISFGSTQSLKGSNSESFQAALSSAWLSLMMYWISLQRTKMDEYMMAVFHTGWEFLWGVEEKGGVGGLQTVLELTIAAHNQICI